MTNLRYMRGGGSKRTRRNTYRYSLENPNGERPFGRPRIRGDDNITMDLKNIGWKTVG
jgi:hypothetical protein